MVPKGCVNCHAIEPDGKPLALGRELFPSLDERQGRPARRAALPTKPRRRARCRFSSSTRRNPRRSRRSSRTGLTGAGSPGPGLRRPRCPPAIQLPELPQPRRRGRHARRTRRTRCGCSKRPRTPTTCGRRCSPASATSRGRRGCKSVLTARRAGAAVDAAADAAVRRGERRRSCRSARRPRRHRARRHDSQGAAQHASRSRLGRQIVGKSGLGCISCHDIGGVANTGTRGPDLATINQRVRYDWYDRWLHQPLRMAPGTRMPQAFVDGKSTLTTVLNGDPKAQAEAMWAYLSLGPGLPLPEGLEPPKGLIIAVKDRPELLRTFMPEAGSKAIAVGYPGGVNLAFSADQCRMAYAWARQLPRRLAGLGQPRRCAGEVARPEVLDRSAEPSVGPDRQPANPAGLPRPSEQPRVRYAAADRARPHLRRTAGRPLRRLLARQGRPTRPSATRSTRAGRARC